MGEHKLEHRRITMEAATLKHTVAQVCVCVNVIIV